MTHNSAYRLAELDGAVSKLFYAAFRLVSYFFSPTSIVVRSQKALTAIV